jgi:PAS domain S-box-containing protein
MTPRPRKASQLATALIEHSSDAIALLDESGTVLYANPATARMLGLPIGEIINANVFRWVHDEDVVGFKANFAKRLDNQACRCGTHSASGTATDRGGTSKPSA